MKTLIVPDIHLDIQWADRVVQQNPADRIILLGDYFDPSPAARAMQTRPKPGQSRDMLHWVTRLIREYGDSVKVLIGNHDAPYLFPCQAMSGSVGNFTARALKEIEVEVDEVRLLRHVVRWFYYDEPSGYLFSHAGIHLEVFADAFDQEGQFIPDRLQTTMDAVQAALLLSADSKTRSSGKLDPRIGHGWVRGGPEGCVGGIDWLDFNAEFEPIPGLKQVVGHTAQWDGPVWKEGNLDLDALQTAFAILEDGELKLGGQDHEARTSFRPSAVVCDT